MNEIHSAVLMRFSRAVERSTSGSLICLFLFLFFYDTLSSLVLGDLTASERVKEAFWGTQGIGKTLAPQV